MAGRQRVDPELVVWVTAAASPIMRCCSVRGTVWSSVQPMKVVGSAPSAGDPCASSIVTASGKSGLQQAANCKYVLAKASL